jgi:hypothetical protein
VRKCGLKLIFLTLTALLLLLCARSSYGAEAPEIILRHIPPGWTSEGEGYFLNAEALSNLTAAAKTYRLERDAWEDAYHELSEKSDIYAADMKKYISELRSQIDEERKTWKSVVRRAKRSGFGVFAGAGYTGSGFEAVVGVGVVWRLF